MTHKQAGPTERTGKILSGMGQGIGWQEGVVAGGGWNSGGFYSHILAPVLGLLVLHPASGQLNSWCISE